jgi:hypothetical protein
MLYSILIYGSDAKVRNWTHAEEEDVLGRHTSLREELTSASKLGPVLRLAPSQAKTVRRDGKRVYIVDGPYAETKEQLLGLYVLDCASFEEAVQAAERLSFETGVFEITPVRSLIPGVLPALAPDPCGSR